jgi:hypothetical protein
MRPKTRRALSYVGLIALATLGVSCEPRDAGLREPEAIAPALATFLARADTAELALDSVAAGGWRAMYIFGAGSNPAPLARFGDDELAEQIERLSQSTTETLLIFRFHHGLHQGVLIPHTAAQFDSVLLGTSITVNRAVFINKSGRLALRR